MTVSRMRRVAIRSTRDPHDQAVFLGLVPEIRDHCFFQHAFYALSYRTR